jgi:hypothetical protein
MENLKEYFQCKEMPLTAKARPAEDGTEHVPEAPSSQS